MSSSGIRTLVIAALLFINVIFLTVIIIDTVADARSERLAIENVSSVLQAGGIMIEPDSIRAGGSLRTMRTVRGDEAEAAIARAVLGPTDMSIHGMIHSYENEERGIADFYSGGDFVIRVNEGVITNGSGTQRVVQRLLRDMRLEASQISITAGPAGESATATGAYRGVSIFNCTIEFVFNGENLELVRGRYVTGVESAEDGIGISQVGTVLLSFLAEVRNVERDDIACTRIYRVEAGYQHYVVGAFGEGVLVPVWLIETDMGLYIINETSGEIQPFGHGAGDRVLR